MAKKKAKSAVSAAVSKVKFRPMGDRVLVLPESALEEKSAAGIIIPDTAKTDRPQVGIVMSVGPGKRGDDNEIIPVSLKVGDKVMFSKYSQDEITIDDKEYFVISESNILGVFNS